MISIPAQKEIPGIPSNELGRSLCEREDGISMLPRFTVVVTLSYYSALIDCYPARTTSGLLMVFEVPVHNCHCDFQLREWLTTLGGGRGCSGRRPHPCFGPTTALPHSCSGSHNIGNVQSKQQTLNAALRLV